MDAYRDAHPIYSRMILRMLASVNGFEGDHEQAALVELPMLELRGAGTAVGAPG
jgi:hypothetical protein